MAKVYLAKNVRHRCMHGHPWIYRSEVDRVTGEWSGGDVVDVLDKDGCFIGRGYINPASQIMIRILTHSAGEVIDGEFFRRRLQLAINWHNQVVRDSDAYRLVYSEADGLPGLIVDYYAGYVVVETLTLGMERYLELVVELLEEMLSPLGIYEHNDGPSRLKEGLPLRTGWLRGSSPADLTIRENGFSFRVDLDGGQKTGYFLDQRENRLALKELVPGARVLDVFCHTGAFAVYAAGFGAGSVEGVDISGGALELARINARLNGVSDRIVFYEENGFDFLRRKERGGELYDVIILDPPAFTKSRKTVADAVRGYKEINLRALKLLKPGGFLLTCSCSYHLTEQMFMEMLQEAALDARVYPRLVEMRRQAKDHPMLLFSPETYYLKCAILHVMEKS